MFIEMDRFKVYQTFSYFSKDCRGVYFSFFIGKNELLVGRGKNILNKNENNRGKKG